MSFVYPRFVNVTRSAVPVDFGASDYQGQRPIKEEIIAQGVPASIQMKRPGSAPTAGLPADASRKTYWHVMIPLGVLKLGQIRTHDIVTDDIGQRYQVVGPYWNSLGYNLLAERLEL